MRIKYAILVVCLLSFCVNSETADLSLNSTERSALSGDEIDRLLSQTDAIRTSDFVTFTKNLSELSAIKNSFSESQLCFYRFLSAYKLGLSGDVEQSIQQLQVIKEDCEYLSITIRVESLLANIYAISGDYQKALTSLDNILSQIDNVNDQALKLLIYSTAYVVYDLVNQNQLSLDFSQLVIDQKPSPKQWCKASVYKYVALINLNQLGIKETEIAEVLNHCRQQSENIYAQVLNVNWIDYQLKKAESKQETNLIHQSLLASDDSIVATRYKNLIVFKDSLMARILEKLGRYEEAVEFAKKALEGSASLGNSQQKIDALDVLINYHQSTQSYKEANDYLLKKNLAKIRYYSDKQEKLMAYQTIKHDSMAKSHRIDFLNQQNEVLVLEKELAEKSKANQLLLNYLFASIAVLLLYIGYRIKKQQEIYKSLSEMDHMTKIYNRKGMKDYMEHMLPYSQEKEETVAFGIFDLDLFKKINDQYGHTVGDWVIKSIVKACKELNNEKATFARLGGEEFALIMRDSTLNDIAEFAEACRSAINSIETVYETGHQFHISASFGITTTQISGYNFSRLMNDADDALYESKENGRNQVTVYRTAA